MLLQQSLSGFRRTIARYYDSVWVAEVPIAPRVLAEIVLRIDKIELC
jgi:hypothetical protein